MSIEFPKPESMYTLYPQGGYHIEGREKRSGLGNMAAATYTKSYTVSNVLWQDVQVPEVPGVTLKQLSFSVDLETFNPIDDILPAKRMECISSWLLSAQEIRRHHALMDTIVEEEIYKRISEIYEAEKEDIHDLMLRWLNFINDQGDKSLDQFKFYVKEHGSSVTPWGVRWDQIGQNDNLLKRAYSGTLKFLRDLISFYPKLVKTQSMIKANFCYPAVRGRPGNYSIDETSKDFKKIRLRVSMYRSRKAGGIVGHSQITEPIFQNLAHKKADKIWDDYFRTNLNGVECHSLAAEGPVVFRQMVENNAFSADIRSGEAQCGEIFRDLGFSVDLSHPQDNSKRGAELYSGVGPTTPINQLYQYLFNKAAREVFDWKPTKWWYFGDNGAWNIAPPLNRCMEPDEDNRFCGFRIKEQKFGPPSLVTDNPKHRVAFHGSFQKQVQNVQVVTRPLLSVIMNGIADRNEPLKFIDWITKESPNLWTSRQDEMKETVENSPLLRAKLLDEFPVALDYVKTYFDTVDDFGSPFKRSDLRIIDHL